MKRERLALLVVLLLVLPSLALAGPGVKKVRFWYHFDDPETAITPLDRYIKD